MEAIDSELSWIAEQIDELKSRDPEASVAVVLDSRSLAASTFAQRLIRELDEIAMPAREAHDEDMRESTDRVMITDSEAVVGLEFDYVSLPALHDLWPDPLPRDARRSFWVAATRAKRFLALTFVGAAPTWLDGRTFGGVTIRSH